VLWYKYWLETRFLAVFMVLYAMFPVALFALTPRPINAPPGSVAASEAAVGFFAMYYSGRPLARLRQHVWSSVSPVAPIDAFVAAVRQYLPGDRRIVATLHTHASLGQHGHLAGHVCRSVHDRRQSRTNARVLIVVARVCLIWRPTYSHICRDVSRLGSSRWPGEITSNDEHDATCCRLD
jgi:hypothetical protein